MKTVLYIVLDSYSRRDRDKGEIQLVCMIMFVVIKVSMTLLYKQSEALTQ